MRDRGARLAPELPDVAAIGDELGIARPTVKTHVQHIYEKLGAANRAEAVHLAESAGLVPAPARPSNSPMVRRVDTPQGTS